MDTNSQKNLEQKVLEQNQDQKQNNSQIKSDKSFQQNKSQTQTPRNQNIQQNSLSSSKNEYQLQQNQQNNKNAYKTKIFTNNKPVLNELLVSPSQKKLLSKNKSTGKMTSQGHYFGNNQKNSNRQNTENAYDSRDNYYQSNQNNSSLEFGVNQSMTSYGKLNEQLIQENNQLKIKLLKEQRKTARFQQDSFLMQSNSNIQNTQIDQNQYEESIVKLQNMNETSYNQIENRKNIINNLTSVLSEGEESLSSYQIKKIQDVISQSFDTLQNVSRNEIQLNRAQKLFEKQKLSNQQLNNQNSKQKQDAQIKTQEIQTLIRQKQAIQDENQKLKIEMQALKFKHSEATRKLAQVEQRLELIARKDSQIDENELRKTLNEVIKENEENKRRLRQKEREIERLKEANSKQYDQVNKLHRKLEVYKMRKLKEDGKENKRKSISIINSKTLLNFPENLNFRLEYENFAQSRFISEIFENGPEQFANQFEDERRENIIVLSNQFLGYKEFGEKNHNINKSILKFLYDEVQHETLMINISKNFQEYFQAQTVQLWILEEQTGILSTFNSECKELRALTDYGMFGALFQTKQIQNDSEEKQVELYKSAKGEENLVMGYKSFLVPLLSKQNEIIGILQISEVQTQNLSTDEQYLAHVLAQFCIYKHYEIIQQNSLFADIKFQDLFHDMIIDLCKSQHKFQFQQGVIKWAQQIFGITSCKFCFVNSQNNKLQVYSGNNEYKEYDGNLGYSGKVNQLQRSMILLNQNKNFDFHQAVDVYSLRPIFVFPILEKIEDGEGKTIKTTLGVAQFVMKSKPVQQSKFDDTKKNVLPTIINLGDDYMENTAKKFSKFVIMAYHLVKHYFSQDEQSQYQPQINEQTDQKEIKSEKMEQNSNLQNLQENNEISDQQQKSVNQEQIQEKNQNNLKIQEK